MVKHPRKVVSILMSNGDENWRYEGCDLYLPETDVEIAMHMVSIKSNNNEMLIFNPMAILLGPKSDIPENIPEEKEIPERDR